MKTANLHITIASLYCGNGKCYLKWDFHKLLLLNNELCYLCHILGMPVMVISSYLLYAGDILIYA